MKFERNKVVAAIVSFLILPAVIGFIYLLGSIFTFEKVVIVSLSIFFFLFCVVVLPVAAQHFYDPVLDFINRKWPEDK